MVGEVDYLLSVQPIFNNHCVTCHSGTFGSGVLELDSYQRLIEGDSNNGPVVLPFNADSSLLYKVLLRDSVIVPKNNNLIIIGSLGIVVLMLGAVATHVRMKNPARDMLPAITMLSIGLIIFLYTFGQAA